MKNYLHLILFLFTTIVGQSQITDSFTTSYSDFKKTSKNEYTVIESSKTTNRTQQNGEPQLPVYTRSYVLPAGSILTNVSGSNGSKVLLNNNCFVFSAQPPCTLNGKPCPDFVAPDAGIYSSATPYPTSTVSLANDVTTFGYHVINNF